MRLERWRAVYLRQCMCMPDFVTRTRGLPGYSFCGLLNSFFLFVSRFVCQSAPVRALVVPVCCERGLYFKNFTTKLPRT